MNREFIKNPVAAYERIKEENERIKTKIRNQINWLKSALNDEDNQSDVMQIKLYAQLDILQKIAEM